MSFLEYDGTFDIMEDSDNYSFNYFNKNSIESLPFFIVPPIYDISFKRAFFYNSDALSIAKDFLNSILFPESKLIREINFIENNTNIVECAYLAKIKTLEKGEVFMKEIIIDIEIFKGKKSNIKLEQCFKNEINLKNENESKETWMILLFINGQQYYYKNENEEFYVKEEFIYDNIKPLNYVKIYKIYLNNVYANLNKITSIINGELIKDEGKEWLKLFCISLWCKSFGDKINYCIPRTLNFKSKEIQKAITILGNIPNIEKDRIKIFEISKIEEEKYQERYREDYNNRFNNGYKNGYNIGYDKGIIAGKNLGISKGKLIILDEFFKNFMNGKSLNNIDFLGPISFSLIKERYKNNAYLEDFIRILKEKNLLID